MDIIPPDPVQSLRADILKGIGIALVVAVVVFSAVVGLLTLISVSNNQANHFQTIQSIQTLAANTNDIAAGLKAGNATVSKILVEAGMAVLSIEASEARLAANEYAVCLAVHAPNCQAPPP